MNKILDSLTKDAKEIFATRKSELRIDNIVIGKTLYTMKGSGHVFTDMNFCLVLLENGYGFSYFQAPINFSFSKYVNKNVVDIIDNRLPRYLKMALIDAMYSIVNRRKFKRKNKFKGDLRSKAKKRARKLLSKVPSRSRVLLLGAASEIIEEVKKKGCNMKVIDLEKQKVGLRFHTVSVEDGQKVNLKKEIMNTDYIIATGMIFVSKTADLIFSLANKEKKVLILYMESGSNFGYQLIRHGADFVLSEFFPYYDFAGNTNYLFFRK